MEGQTTLANIGDRVHCVGTTSCGLVVAYGENGKVASYHWPFMTDTPERHAEFNKIVGRLDANVKFIQVVTNDFPNQEQAATYKAAVVKLRKIWKVPTTYYINEGQIRGGDPFVELQQNGVKSVVFKIVEVPLS
jgi:hypothetical protein